MKDFDAITDAGTNNEARFYRDYARHSFNDTLPFENVKNFLGWHVSFRVTSFTTVDCHIDEDVANSMADWRTGQRFEVTGTIHNTIMGSLILEDCRFKAV
jgi:hypothetical protein